MSRSASTFVDFYRILRDFMGFIGHLRAIWSNYKVFKLRDILLVASKSTSAKIHHKIDWNVI